MTAHGGCSRRRWRPRSPRTSTPTPYRAGQAVLAYAEQRGVSPLRVHLHGDDVDRSDTPYYAGFELRYFPSIPWCLTRRQSTEWIEVVNPTRTKPLAALRITPANRDLLADADWS